MKRMNLQLFAEPTGGAGGTEPPAGGQNQQQTQTQTGQQASLAIDYAKIQQMLEGTLAAKEDTALKAYFKQQGLSQEEVEPVSYTHLDNADQATITELRKYKRLKGCLYNFWDAYKQLGIIDRINLQLGWIQQGCYLVVDTLSLIHI